MNGLFISAILFLLSFRAASGELPVPCSTGCGAANNAWVRSGSASLAVSGNSMLINQSSDKVGLNWNTFNIGAGNTVRFHQPDSNSIAVNRVWDPASNPSRILGSLKANGRVYIINRNGVIFGEGARVDVQGLVASTMNVADEVLDSGLAEAFKNRQAAFGDDEARAYIVGTDGKEMKFRFEEGAFPLDEDGKLIPDENGQSYPIQVVVEEGASLKAKPYGRIMLFGASVTNKGNISTPDGQTILAAGNKIYLQTNSDLRGFLVEVDVDAVSDSQLNDMLTPGSSADLPAGNVTNIGNIVAPRGNVSMAGLAINQQGRVSATRAVSSNGSIRLMARSNVGFNATSASTANISSIRRTGRITFGKNSRTDILLDSDTADATEVDATSRKSSLLELEAMGAVIEMEARSAIRAPSGEVGLTATSNPLPPQNTLVEEDEQVSIRLADSSLIDVSGTEVELAMERNVVETELRGNEFADTPLQRDSGIKGKKVRIDIRTVDENGRIPLGIAQGALDNIQRKVDERSTTGGTVTIKSTGGVDIEAGATVDVSGGGVKYKSGIIDTTYLVSNGRIAEISEADPNWHDYHIQGVITNGNEKWGAEQHWITPSGKGGRYERGYFEGADAGTLQISGYKMNVVNSQLIGHAYAGPYQRGNDTRPKGGTLILGDPTGQGNLLGGKNYVAPHILIAQNKLIADLQKAAQVDPASWPVQTVILNTDMFTQGGFTAAELYSNGKIILNKGIELAPGGHIAMTAPEIQITHDIHIPSGDINIQSRDVNQAVRLNASNSDPLVFGSLNPQNHGQIIINDGVTLDVEGTWSNDTPYNPLSRRSIDYSAPTMVDGGDISLGLNSNNGALTIGNNVVFQTSGGAWLAHDGHLHAGTGGDIKLKIGSSGKFDFGNNLDIRSYGLQQGGTLSFELPKVIIAGSQDDLSMERQQQILAQGQTSDLSGEDKDRLKDFIISTYQSAVEQLVSNTDGFPEITEEDIALALLQRFDADDRFNTLRVSDNVLYQEILLPVAQTFGLEGAIDAQNPTAEQTGFVSGRISSLRTMELPVRFFQQGGFSAYEITANSGNLVFSANTELQPTSQNYIASGNFNTKSNQYRLSDFATVGRLPFYLRKATDLSVTAEISTLAATMPQLILPETATIKYDEPGAQVRLSSNGAVLVGGSVIAPGGNIALTVNNEILGNTDYFNPSRGIILDATSVLSAQGTTVFTPNEDGRRYGKVLAGGYVSLDAVGGFVDIRNGAEIDVSGDQARLDYVVRGADKNNSKSSKNSKEKSQTIERHTISSSAGEISVQASEWLQVDGDLRAHAGGEGAAGGRLTVALDRSSVNDTVRDNPTNGYVSGKDKTWTLTLTKGTGDFGTGDMEQAASGSISLPQIYRGGFDAVELFSTSKLELEEGLRLKLDRALKIDAPIIQITNFEGNVFEGSAPTMPVQLDAPYIAIGPDPAHLPRKEGEATTGDGELNIGGANTHFVELLGSTVLQGVGHTRVFSQGDVRLRASQGDFVTNGNLLITADQVYPSTLSTFRLASLGATGTVAFERNDNTTPTPVLSAGGKLTVNANTIVQNGIVKVPLGELVFEAIAGAEQGTVTLGHNSVTSTSADAAVIPFGETINGGDEWRTRINTTLVEVYDENGPGLIPQQKLALKADKIAIEEQATTDISGGGELVAFEFLPGPGGTIDVTSASVAQGEQTYAILPWLKDTYAPYDWSIYRGWDIETGSSVHLLASSNGLPAGIYPLLPAKYALLPGAYFVTHVNGYENIKPGIEVKMTDGSRLTPGLFTIANTNIRSPLNTAFAVRKGSEWWSGKTPTNTSRSEFQLSYLNSYLEKKSIIDEFIMPRLTRDAGHMVLSATSGLDISGNLLTNAAGNAAGVVAKGGSQGNFRGRGADVDIVASSLRVGNGGGDGNFNGITISGEDLEKFKAESLLLGGTRELTEADEMRIVVGAQDIEVYDNLTAPEIILAAASDQSGAVADSGNITVYGEVKSAGKASGTPRDGTPRDIVLGPGDGALLRISESGQVKVRRESYDGQQGRVEIKPQANIISSRSVTLDSTNEMILDGNIEIAKGSLSVGARHISLGEVPQNTPGFVLTNELLNHLSLNELVLVSDNPLDVYGNASLGLGADGRTLIGSLQLLTDGIRGIDNTGDSNLFAGNISVGKPSMRANKAYDGAGGEFTIGDGEFQMDGFEHVAILADAALITDGNGTLAADSDLLVNTPHIISTSSGNTAITAGNHRVSVIGPESQWQAPSGATLNIAAKTDNNATGSQDQSPGLGGKLTVTGDSVQLDTTIAMPSGYVSLTATNGDIALGEKALIDVAGVTRTFGDMVSVGTWGGMVQLTADNGNVKMAQSARIDVSGAASTQTDAGAVFVTALGNGLDSGFADLKGELLASGQSGYGSGLFSIDAYHIGDSTEYSTAADKQQYLNSQFNQLNNSLEQGSFHEARRFRVREGDLELNEDVVIHAHEIDLTADTGKIAINGYLDASGETGGDIAVYADSDITLHGNARLNASADGGDQRGGEVVLASKEGQIRIEETSAEHDYTINTAGTRLRRQLDGSPIVDEQNQPVLEHGSVHLRAARTAQNNDLNIDIINGIITNASVIDIEGVKTYTDGDTEITGNLLTGDNQITAADIGEIRAQTDAFMLNAQTILDRIHSPNTVNMHVVPGLEINSEQNLTLMGDWDFNQWRYGDNLDIPGRLAIRSNQNLTLAGNVVDGFNLVRQGTVTKEQLATGDSWSYRFVAGADFSSANPQDTVAGSGTFTLGSAKVIRTGTGDIDIASGGDVVLASKESVIFTSGRHTLEADAPGLFDDKRRTKEWPTDGGNISISAGTKIISAQMDQLALPWLWRQGGGSNLGKPVKTEWAIDIPKFSQGVAAFGGGNINVTAGGDIENLSVSIPTTGKQLSDDPADIVQWGGGDLVVKSSGDIKGGSYYVGRGEGHIVARGGIVEGAPGANGNATPTILLVGDAEFALNANKGIMLGTAANPTVLPRLTLGREGHYESSFYTYSDRSAVRLSSLAGNVKFQTQTSQNLAALYKKSLYSSSGRDSDMALQVYPSTLQISALGGDIEGVNPMVMFPSSLGQLDLIAAGNVQVANLNMSDADPQLLPGPQNPNDFLSRTFYSVLDKSHGKTPLHEGDAKSINVLADGGNITGIYRVAKQALFVAGRDIKDIKFEGQNIHDTDVTLFMADRDIRYSGIIDPFAQIAVGGPGRLDLVAGRNINLGGSAGVTTQGNLKNLGLAKQGADISILVGVRNNASYQDFIARYIKVHPKFDIFAQHMRDQSGDPTLNDADALQYFKALDNKEDVLASLNLSEKDITQFEGIIAYQRHLNEFVATLTNYAQAQTLSPQRAFEVYRQLSDDRQQEIQTRLNLTDVELASLQDSYNYQLSAVQAGELVNSGASLSIGTGESNVVVTQEALMQFAKLSPLQQRSVVLASFFNELKQSGRYAVDSETPKDYSRGFAAISTLFPGDKTDSGDLSMYASRIYTLDGGDINILAPGGMVNAGLAKATKKPNELGVVAQREGNVSTYTYGDFLVNQSRVFTLLGGDILMWSSFGNIDAGRGAKSAVSAPAPNVTFDQDGNPVIEIAGAITGSGIRVITTSKDIDPGTVDLYTPNGIVDAGDAGIEAPSIHIDPDRLENSENVTVGGEDFVTPSALPNIDFGGGSDLADSIKKSTEQTIADVAEDSTNTPIADAALSYLEVFVIGLGEESGPVAPKPEKNNTHK